MATTRPFDPAKDRTAVLAFLRDARGIDSPGHRLFVAEDNGTIVGLSLWMDVGENRAYLALVLSPEGDVKTFHQVIEAAVRDAVEQGITEGYSSIRDPRIVRQLERTFALKGIPSGWNGETGKVVQWDVHVDTVKFLAQLERVI